MASLRWALTFGNELSVVLDGLGLRLLETRQDRTRLQPLGCFARHCAIAAPRPVARRSHDLRPHRIEHRVARELQQVGVLLHQDRLVARLKDMAAAVADVIEPLRINAAKLTHTLRQTGRIQSTD